MLIRKRGRKAGKKGQSANEAAMLIMFMTFFLIITLAAVSDDIIKASNAAINLRVRINKAFSLAKG